MTSKLRRPVSVPKHYFNASKFPHWQPALSQSCKVSTEFPLAALFQSFEVYKEFPPAAEKKVVALVCI